MAVKERERGASIKDAAVNLKNYVVALPKKQKIISGAVVGAVILAAVILAVALNSATPEYRPLYTGLTSTEATSIYAALQEMGAEAQMDADGVIMVPTKDYDQLLLALAAQGYPQSTNTYDIFSSHTGLTATESEKKTYLLYQLQSTLENTLRYIGGVRRATVNITIPDTSTFVWQQADQTEKASAGVLLNLDPGVTLNAEQVTAIKNLVASSVPQLEASEVTVVNAATSLELSGVDTESAGALSENKGLLLEQQVQKQIEDNIVRLLTPRYGKDGVVAAAKVTLDLDKMLTEQHDYITQTPNPDGTGGGGYDTHTEVSWGVNGEQPLPQGVVGEEDNTDLPGYAYGTGPDEDGGATGYRKLTETEYGYITTQIERGNYVLQRATISVLVDEDNLTAGRSRELTNLVSTGADIPAADITVGAFRPGAEVPEPKPPEDPAPGFWPPPTWFWFAAGGGLLLIVISVAAVLLIRRRSKRRLLAQAEEMENSMQSMEGELEKYRQELEAAAKASADPKEELIVNEVRDFAKQNPEITANLLKSWMREDE